MQLCTYAFMPCALLATPSTGTSVYEKVDESTTFHRKPFTIFIYVAARNDLLSFIDRNLAQLMQVGTNANLNILVHLNTIHLGYKKLTQKFIIYKNKMVQVGESAELDSGIPETFIAGCTWAFSHFPADSTAVVLWNHGTGGLEVSGMRAINPSALYRYNPTSQRVELNRAISFVEYLEQYNSDAVRGICFDDLTKHYLTNKQVGDALRTVSDQCLDGNPVDLVLCDACLMSCVEFAFSLKPHGQSPVARYLVSSQEVVLALGYPYTKMLAKMAQVPQSPSRFAEHVVKTFGQTYAAITEDFTQSALDLTQIDPLYESFATLSQLLMDGMRDELQGSVRAAIRMASSKDQCTYFEEPTYKDIHHFLLNLIKKSSNIQLRDSHATAKYRQQLIDAATKACENIERVVIANSTGYSLRNAQGISVYLPTGAIHPSYNSNQFAIATRWLDMIRMYNNATRDVNSAF